jgi:uncharacterized protein YndB with AHSA1/START domain
MKQTARPDPPPSTWRRVLSCEIAIDAPPDAVWAVLTDLASHRAWNSYAPEWSGELVPGGALHIVAKPGGSTRRFRATVREVDPPRRLVYESRIGAPALMRMSHEIELRDEPAGAGPRCTLVQHERISGLLVPLVWRIFERQAGAGFTRMNEDLKRAAEARSKGAI